MCRDVLAAGQNCQSRHHICFGDPNSAHCPDNHQYVNDTTPDNMLIWATGIGIATKEFVETNLADARHYAAKLKSLINLKREVRQQGWQPNLEAACNFVIRMKCFSVSRLRAVLKRHTFEVQQMRSLRFNTTTYAALATMTK
jgi:hypothetical protein